MKRIILKILKWISIVFVILIIAIVGVIYLNTHKDPNAYFGITNEAKNILLGIGGDTKKAEKELTKVQKMENSWREFDFSDIEGESPYMVFGTKATPSLGKYQIQDIKIYEDIGFVVGDNRNEARSNATPKPVHPDKIEELMQAYVFRTTDGGKTFDRQCLGHGSAVRVKRINDDFYVSVTQFDTKTGKVFKSKDMGETWKETNITPWVEINKDIMIAKIKPGIITYDGAKTWEEPSKNLQTYISKYGKYPFPEAYQGKLVSLKDRTLVFFNLETDQEEIVPLNIPKGKIIDDDPIHSDKETGELSIRLFPDIVGNPREEQSSIWFPLEDKEVIFDKKLPETVFLEVHGKFIGGFIEVKGILTNIWTLNKGETWNYELLPNYFFGYKAGYGNGQIWLTTYVDGKKNLEEGSYLAIGTLKGYKEEDK